MKKMEVRDSGRTEQLIGRSFPTSTSYLRPQTVNLRPQTEVDDPSNRRPRWTIFFFFVITLELRVE